MSFIFLDERAYENILTTTISRFTVHLEHAPRRVVYMWRRRRPRQASSDRTSHSTDPLDQLNGSRAKKRTPRCGYDPKDLNRAIRQEHYPLPTIEDIATRLHGAPDFSILDVCHGFWHVPLDEPSSFLTTFQCRKGATEEVGSSIHRTRGHS